MIEQEAILAFLKQILAIRPDLRKEIKESRDFLFALIGRVYLFDAFCREIFFEKEERKRLFASLLEPTFVEIEPQRLQYLFEQILRGAQELVKEELFRSLVAKALLDGVRARGLF